MLKVYTIAVGLAVVTSATSTHALTVTQTTDPAALAAALGGAGLTIDSISIVNGAPDLFGTYTDFSAPPVTFGNGVVMSSGLVTEVAGPASPFNQPSTSLGSGGTPAYDAYGPGNIENFFSSNDVAALQVNFTLDEASQIQFDFIFGSVEFPDFVSNFTDAFIVFLDGTDPEDQITFDANGEPVQVGMSFLDQLRTDDNNTAFADPHALIDELTTTSVELGAGSHFLRFEVGDVNDGILDSAVFIANLRTGEGDPGTEPNGIPVPASLALLGFGVASMTLFRRRHV